MSDGERIIDEGRLWVETPFVHQGRAMGAGVDCIGLIKEVGVSLDFLHPTPAEIEEFGRYGRAPNPRRMRRGLETFLTPQDFPLRAVAPDGCIAWMQWREDMPMHVGFASTFQGRRTVIHAVQDIGKVVEHGFTSLWLGRVVAWYTYPGMRF